MFRELLSAIVTFPLLAAFAVVPGQVDSICRDKCVILAAQDGRVRLIDQWLDRSLDLGKYAEAAHRLVPQTEAPVGDFRSRRGWRVIASVYLVHEGGDDGGLMTHIRFFGPDGKLRATDEALFLVIDTEIGNLFGGADEIFAITSEEEHSYNVQSDMWLLPEHGAPKLLLRNSGDFKRLSGRARGEAPGVLFAHQTYDGANPDTKGFVEQFYEWDRKTKSLTFLSK
jgi:hypothetical protein